MDDRIRKNVYGEYEITLPDSIPLEVIKHTIVKLMSKYKKDSINYIKKVKMENTP